ncbi:hypothetical protein [Bacteroides acidifaciens]|uniref:hypothetical protein n=1 Tax=Bacteroides acidifaciens TaxID=85831 RepID=UPI003F68CB2B
MIRDVFASLIKRPNELIHTAEDLIILHPIIHRKKVMKLLKKNITANILLVDERKDEIIGVVP